MTPEEIEELNAQHVEPDVLANVTAINNRIQEYPELGEQLDKLYHDMIANKLDTTGEWHKSIKAVKDSNPKTE
tara:strand:- start:20 stop:238 length:219 start_codon:yes stop_codon:yes gene_type:complete